MGFINFIECSRENVQISYFIFPTVHKILKSLHSLNVQYSKLNTALFAKHMPGIHLPMTEEDIQSQIMAERELQQRLRESGFNSGNQSRKRPNSEEENGARTS